MTQRYGKQPKYLRNGLDPQVILKYLRNGFTMLEMALEFDKQLNYVENDVCMWETA